MNVGEPEQNLGDVDPKPDERNQRVQVQPAELPQGLLPQMDYLLRHPDAVLESIRQDLNVGALCKLFLLIALASGGVYGFIMGGTNLFQGSETGLGTELLYMLTASVKVPVLFLVTLLIVLPPMYVSGVYAQVRLSMAQVGALLLFATAIATLTLASMATVALFFALTTRTYEFMKLLHVLVFAYAGLTGILFLVRAYRAANDRLHEAVYALFLVWLLLYGFVGTQLAWVLRPFIGTPDMAFTLFREQYGNFYENVARTFVELMR